MSATPSTLPTSEQKPAHQPPQKKLAWLGSRVLSVGLFLAAGVLLIVLVGLAQRLNWIRRPAEAPAAATSAHAEDTIFTCPMHPNIRQPSPGRCPICGMELVPASSAGGASLDEFAVQIQPAQRRLANIETAEVKAGPLQATLQTVGAIAIDESRQATIAAYVDGRLERLFADYTGVHINKGDHLAVIYSPQLFGAQVEYLEARRALSGTAAGLPAVRQAQEALAANTFQRLREFGMSKEQLEQLEQAGTAQSRLTIYAPQAGTVVEKLAIEGNYVKAGDPIYRIANLSTVWLMLKLFPEDASRVRFGQQVQATIQSLPEKPFIGRVAFIDPTVDAENRTVDVRVELNNEDGRLRPGDYAEARIDTPIGPQGEIFDEGLAGKWISPMHPQIVRDEPGPCPICGMDLVPTSEYGYAAEPVPQPSSLYVPRSAVLLAGGNSVVYVETEPGRFEIRPVTIGPILHDKIVILDGLKEGEQVATSGNFLIDSQMQLAGKPSLIDSARAIAKKVQQKGPLVLKDVTVASISGEAGTKLEQLYAAYFKVQKTLAADQKPLAEVAQGVAAAARELSEDEAFPEASRKLLQEIAKQAEHLHHMDLAGARKAFKPISHAIVTLATQVRGAEAQQPFTHFYCPMVPEGGGDWLQAGGELLNPYFGSEMLRCGEKVTEYPPGSKSSAEPELHDHHESGQAKDEDA
jgi:membrane fusion protein, copper/silver efflux system